MYLKPFNVENSIDFNSEDFEKKVLFEDEYKRIMLVALEKEQKMPKHFAPVDAVVYVLKGEVSFIVDSVEYDVKAGEMFILPAKTEHCVTAKESSKFIVVRL